MSILIAYDGRPNTERALDYAINHSINYGEPLYILTVVTEEQMDPEHPDQEVREYMEAAQHKASSEGADAHTIIEIGDPDDTVPQVAENYQCETIVIGRSDKSHFQKLINGSVSDSLFDDDRFNLIIVSGDQAQ